MSVKEVVQIRQATLQEMYELGRDIAAKQQHLEEMERSVKDLLFAKAPVEEGRFTVRLVKKAFKNPPWKQIVIEELGAAFMEQVRKRFPARVRFEVLVEEHAIPPLWRQSGDGLTA